MERKFYPPNGQSFGLHRTLPASQHENCRKMLQLGRSTVPRLPPILPQDLQVSTNTTNIKISEDFSPRDSVVSLNKEGLQSAKALPRLERTPFNVTTHFTRLKTAQEPTTANYSKNYERPDLRSQAQVDMMRVERTKKQEIPGLSDGLLRGRRKRKDRLSSYKCASSSEVIDDEISCFEQRVGFDSLPGTTTKAQNFVKDMKGRFIRSSDIYGEGGASSLISILDNDEDEKSKKSIKETDFESDSPKTPEKSNPVRERFLKALDTHFYNEYLAAQTGRRMAICEELEKLISGDGRTSLNGLREHLRLQDVLDSWVL